MFAEGRRKSKEKSSKSSRYEDGGRLPKLGPALERSGNVA
jgi:hypothetical protein